MESSQSLIIASFLAGFLGWAILTNIDKLFNAIVGLLILVFVLGMIFFVVGMGFIGVIIAVVVYVVYIIYLKAKGRMGKER